MEKIICNSCGRDFETSANFCPFCGAPLKKQSTGKGFAVVSMLLGILSCFYSFVFGMSAAMRTLFSEYQMPNSWLMEEMLFAVIIICSVCSIILSGKATLKGNKSKMKNAGTVLSFIAMVVSAVIFMLLKF